MDGDRVAAWRAEAGKIYRRSAGIEIFGRLLTNPRLKAGTPNDGERDMPTVVKERVDSKPASGTKTNPLGTIALLLGIAVAGALLASRIEPPADIVPISDMLFAP